MKTLLKLYIIGVALGLVVLPSILSAQAPLLDWGKSILDTINPASEIETYRTPLFAPGDRIFLRVSPVSSLVRPRIRLINQNGTVVKSAQTNNAFTTVELFWTVPTGGGGTYNIVVSDNSATYTGVICISLQRFNNPPESVLMACNSSQNSSMSCPSTFKTFKYSVKANALSELVITPTNSLIRPKVWVCDVDGNIIAKDSTKNAFTAVSILVPPQPVTQCYYVLVTEESGSYTGNFSISHGLLAGECATASIQGTPTNGVVCLGDQFSLNAVTDVDNPIFQWKGPNNFTSNQATLTFDAVTLAHAGVYTLTVTDERGCILITASKTIKVINLTATITPTPANGIVCQRSELKLNITTNAVNPIFDIRGPNGFRSTNPVITLSNVGPAQSGVYQVTVTDENGCIKTASRTITVISFNATLASDPGETVCFGSNFRLNASSTAVTATTYLITGPGGFSTSNSSVTFTNSTLSRAGTYNLTVTDANGCKETANRSIKVINFFATLQRDPSNTNLCAGDKIDLLVSTDAAKPTFKWLGPNNFNSTLSKLSLANLAVAQSGSYAVTVTDENGCTKKDSTKLVVNPIPSIAITTDPQNAKICAGESVSLTMTSDANTNFRWTTLNGSQVSTNRSIEVTPAESTTYFAKVTNITTGCSNQANKVVLVNPLPKLSVSVIGNLCVGDKIELSVSTDAAKPSFRWVGPNFNSTLSKASLTNLTVAQSGTYTVTVTDENGCTKKDSTKLVVNPLPSIAITTDPQNARVCVGESVRLTVSSDANTNFRWTTLNGSLVSTNRSIEVTPAESTTYFAKVTNITTGCSNQANKVVLISPLPKLSVSVRGNTIFASVTNGTLPYRVSVIDEIKGTKLIFADSIGSIPKGNHRVMVEDANGCTAETVVSIITVSTDVVNPSVWGMTITPNPSDGLFQVLVKNPPVESMSFNVLNTMGMVVRSSTLKRNTTLDLSDMPAGVYVLQVWTGNKIASMKMVKTR